MRELVAAVDATCLIIEHQRRRPENWNASREQQTRKRRAVGWKIVVCGHSCRVLADPASVTRCAEDEDLLSISSFRGAQDRVRPSQDGSSQGEAETVPLRRADETILQPGQLIHAFVIPTVVEAPSDLLLDDVRAGHCEMGRDLGDLQNSISFLLYQREHRDRRARSAHLLSDKISEARWLTEAEKRILTSNLARMTGFAPVPS